MPPVTSIHGVVLAGGRGTRMGGLDKGLQPYAGRALAQHAAQRLQPQVGSLSISANRHLDAYRAFGWSVEPDDPPGGRGPLDGLATALARTSMPWVATVPCDSPLLPPTLVARLAEAVDTHGADAAVAVTIDRDGTRRAHHVVSLVRTALLPDLRRALDAGERRVGAWLRRQRLAEATFDDADAFVNLNTADELRARDAAFAAVGTD